MGKIFYGFFTSETICARLMVTNPASMAFWVLFRAFSNAVLMWQLTHHALCSEYSWMAKTLGASTAL